MKNLFLAMIALITGLIFFAGATASLATASKPQASKQQKWKKPHAKKNKG
jgi:hypothetical protein